MTAPHIFAIDIDGTLLNSDHTITKRTHSAIAKVREAGHRVTIATGRMAASTLPIAEQLGLDLPLICLNGADIVDPTTGTSRSIQPIDPASLKRLSTRLRELGIDYFLLGHRLAVSQSRQYGSYDTILTRSLETYLTNPIEPILKLTIDCKTEAQQHKLYSELWDWKAFDMTRSLDGQIYATAYDITKLSGIRELCSLWDIPLQRVIAFGNAENDLTMLLHVGAGIAMANADDCILNRISRRTATNDQDGVALYMEQFMSAQVTT